MREYCWRLHVHIVKAWIGEWYNCEMPPQLHGGDALLVLCLCVGVGVGV